MTQLASAIASGAPAKLPAASRLLAALSGRRVLLPITVPGLDLPATMTLVGAERSIEIEGEVLAEMHKIGLDQSALTVPQYELARAVRFLADAVRERAPDGSTDLPPPLGSLKEWGQLDPPIIADLWRTYGDLVEQRDPASIALTSEEMEEIRDAIAKKKPILLRCFGVRKLAGYLITTADQPASSPTATSEPGASSSES